MDPTNIVAIAFVALGVWLVSRPFVQSVAATGDVVAQLFVPPNRALGWPRGVQESDAPWGWRPASVLVDPPAAADPSYAADLEPLDPDELAIIVRAGSFVVPVQPVRRH